MTDEIKPEILIAALLITAGAAWASRSGWALIAGGVALLALTLLSSSRR